MKPREMKSVFCLKDRLAMEVEMIMMTMMMVMMIMMMMMMMMMMMIPFLYGLCL